MSSPSEPPFPFTDAPADLTLASSSAPGLAEPAWLAIRAFKVYTLIYVLPEPGAVDAEPRVRKDQAIAGLAGLHAEPFELDPVCRSCSASSSAVLSPACSAIILSSAVALGPLY